jgi:hypothetical protein
MPQRPIVVLSFALCLAACGRGAATPPTAPTAAAVAFGLSGRVSDSAGHPLAQAQVEVLDGPRKGTVTLTGDDGTFAFGQIFTSAFTLRASKDGHHSQSKPISTAQSDAFFKLELDLGGSYTITFAADAACTGLPAAVRSRTYSASFDPRGDSSYLATLGGADFGGGLSSYPVYNVLYATVVEDVGHIFFSDPEIWEHLARAPDRSPESDLVIIGDARGAVRSDTSEWSFAGTFAYCPAPETDDYPECEVPVIRCQSENHHLTLTRTR